MKLEMPETFNDVAVYFSREEWNVLSNVEKELHREVMVQNYLHMVSIGYNMPNENLFLLLEKHGKLVPNVKEEILSRLQMDLSKVNLSISSWTNISEAQCPRMSVKEQLSSECARIPFMRNMFLQLRKGQHKCVENGSHFTLRNEPEMQPQTFEKKKLYKLGECKKNLTCTFITDFQDHTRKSLNNRAHSCQFIKNSRTFQRIKRRESNYELMTKHQKMCIKNKPYNFGRCKMNFTQKCELMEHKKFHTGKRGSVYTTTLKCPNHLKKERKKVCKYAVYSNGITLKNNSLTTYNICSEDKSFMQKENLRIHKVHTEAKPYTCATCNRSFVQKGSLANHEKIHMEEKLYKCSTCNKTFIFRHTLAAHEKSHTGGNPYNCTTCGKNFRWKSCLSVHEKIHTGEKPYKCATCGKGFTDKSNLIAHERTHTGEKPYTCAKCGKSFMSKSSLRAHERMHMGEKPFTCATCGKSLTRKYYLLAHQKLHTGEQLYKCATCGKRFTSKRNLTVHERMHTGEKPYTCAKCGKSFTQKGSLMAHGKLHTREQPCKCTTCGKSFTSKSTLTVHERIHTGERPYTCVTCGKSFTQKGSLMTHGKLHAREQPFKCATCDKSFTNKSSLTVHERTHIQRKSTRKNVKSFK